MPTDTEYIDSAQALRDDLAGVTAGLLADIRNMAPSLGARKQQRLATVALHAARRESTGDARGLRMIARRIADERLPIFMALA